MNSPLCDSNFNLFGFLVAPIASFHEALDKLKSACFKTNVCFQNAKKLMLIYFIGNAMGIFLSISDYHTGIPS